MINNFTKNVLTGYLLSDGYIQIKKKYINGQLCVKQAVEFYIKNLWDICYTDNLVKANYRKYDYLDKRN